MLQTVAWTGMLVTYAQQTSIRDAVAKTFDGKHPCRLCKLVREGQQSEKESPALLPLIKIESMPCATAFVLYPPEPISLPLPADLSAARRVESPPFQPPRAA